MMLNGNKNDGIVNAEVSLKLLIVHTLLILQAVQSSSSVKESDKDDVDPNGYIAYCPCMGRFGNQADQFLGTLAFAKELNRTLILPPWVEYIPYQAGSLQIPFDTYFQVEPLKSYHRVILMGTFMKEFAPTVWPKSKRISFCFVERGQSKGCDAKDGNPFGPFWDNFNVDFVGSEIFGPNLHYIIYPNSKFGSYSDWTTKYTPDKWPVLAFVGPPASFPVEERNVQLQQYLVRNEKITAAAKDFIKTLPKGPFIGVHIRNGIDWSRACELINEVQHDELFASPQCTGYRSKQNPARRSLTPEMCFPTPPTIIKQLKRAVKKTNATSVFVASDKHLLINELRDALKKLNVGVFKLEEDSPHTDLAILAQANYFIGNCVSSFSAFVKRERDVTGLKSEFWAYPPNPKKIKAANSSSNEDVGNNNNNNDNEGTNDHDEL